MFYRHDLARPLFSTEVDQNFHDLDDRITAIEDNPPVAASISNIVVNGRQMTIFLENGEEFGPFTLPSAAFNWRGQWTALTGYFEFDLFINGDQGLFLVLQNHVSGSTFDPDIENSDEPILQQVLGPFDFNNLNDLSDVDGTPAHGAILRYNLNLELWESFAANVPQDKDDSTYTVGTDDLERYLRFTDAGGCVITVESVTNETFWDFLTLSANSGQEIHFRQQGGPLTFVAGAGVTINGVAGFLDATNRVGAVATMKYVGENEWDLFGLLEPDGSVDES